MTTTEVKEPTAPATPQNDDSASNISKNTTNKKSTRPEFVYDARDKESFYKDLQTFHESRNTPYSKLPKINGIEIDLHKLYSEVISRGGWLKVNIRNEWDEILPALKLPQKCVNASVALKYIYTRYLDKFEKAHFLGEDPDKNDEPDEDSRHKKWSLKTLHSVPLTYNYAQHIVPEPLRVLHKLSTELYKGSEYEKLLLSLMSPLPNEQDFAINVCTLMANESKHTLKIEHCPKLIDALLAHAGVFCHFTMRDLFMQFYSRIRKHSLQSFWTDCLYKKPQILEMSFDDYFQSPDEKLVDMGLCRPPLRLQSRDYFEDGLNVGVEECRGDFGKFDFLALGRGLGTHDYVGQRVNQVASIMRNLSFFEENIITLAKNRTFVRFLVMCANVRWGNLHHAALDILGNIGHELDLTDPSSDDLTRCLLSTLCEGLEGQDRGVIISSLEILNKLCQKEANEDHIHKCLDRKVYNQICLFLTLNDIMLLLYTLECAYALSSLGPKSCNSIIQVKGIVDTLVSLITVEAQSYGPDGCILMRVVETVPGNMLPMVAQNLANLQNVPMLHQQQVALQQQPHHTPHQSAHLLPPQPPPPTVPQQQQQQAPVLPQQSHHTPTPPQINQQQQQNQQTLQNPQLQQPTIPQQSVSQGVPSTDSQKQPQKQQSLPNNAQLGQQVQGVNAGLNLAKPAKVTQSPAPPNVTIKEPMTPHQNSIIKGPQLQFQENEQLALAWIKATFEFTGNNTHRVEQQELYKMYALVCQKLHARANAVSPIHFPRLVRIVFGDTIGPCLLKTTEPNGLELNAFYYISLRIRAQPLTIQYKGITVAAYTPNHVVGNHSGKMTHKVQAQNKTQTNQQIEVVIKPKPQEQVTQLIQTKGNQITPNMLPGKEIIINKNLTATSHVQQIQNNVASPQINSISNQVIINAKNNRIATTTQQQFNHIIPNSNSNANTTIGNIATGNGPTSSSLIKSLLANKVTTATTTVTETNASATPNNTSCLITQNVNLHQVAQRQHLQKQKELAQQQQQQQQQQLLQNQTNTPALTTTTISALVNNPNIQNTTLKVGQTTIKAITTNAALPNTIIEKKILSSNDVTDANSWEPVPPLAPLSGNLTTRTANNTIALGVPNDDSNSTGNNSIASSILSTTQINTTDDGESSYISFEGLLVPKSKSETSSMTEDEGSSKDSFNKSTHMFNANQMLVDLLDRKSGEPPIGISIKRKLEDDFNSDNENAHKKEKTEHNNNEDEETVPVTASKNAANLYAEMAASILEDEELEEEPQIQTQIQPQIQPPPPPPPTTPQHTIIQKLPEPQKQVITVPVPLQRQIIMSPPTTPKVILSQNAPQQQQMPTQATATIKTDSGLQTVPVILQKQVGPAGQQIIQPVIQQHQPQTQYMLATNQQGQTYLVAQQQPAMNQTLLVTQGPSQQQGTPTKTIIILQQPGGPPQAVAQQQIIGTPGSSQKVIMTTQQGQQMIVTQVPRPMQHHQIIMNHPNATMVQTNPHQSVVFTQTPIIQQQQQPQMQIQAPIQPQISKQIQIQAQPTLQIQPAVQQATQQQPSILSQLPQIPATIKIHTHQPAIQAQTQSVQNMTKTLPQKNVSVIQQPSVSIVAQQHPQQQSQQQQQLQQQQQPQQQQQSAPQLMQQKIIQQNMQQERKTIFVTNSIESPSETATPPPLTNPPLPQPQPPPGVQNPMPMPAAPSTPPLTPALPKNTKTMTDIKTDEELVDPNWLWVCDWRGCPRKKFKSLKEVYRHACKVHCPDNLDPGAEIYCQWGPGSNLCDNIPRKRFSLMTHLSDRHCTLESFKAAVQRRLVTGVQTNTNSQPVTIIKNVHTSSSSSDIGGTASPTHSTSSSGSMPSAASAAMHAIKRHSNDFMSPKELTDENEGPVTKSIRLTAALVLRNLVMYTTTAKRNVRHYEPHLAGVALSNVESSRTVAQILYEINN